MYPFKRSFFMLISKIISINYICRPQVGPMWAPWTLLSGSAPLSQSTGGRCISIKNCQQWGKHFHVMTLSWILSFYSSIQRREIDIKHSHCGWYFHYDQALSCYRNLHRIKGRIISHMGPLIIDKSKLVSTNMVFMEMEWESGEVIQSCVRYVVNVASKCS